ncbi:Inositol 2-dehydrogenase/D-chiro-inositol 3-dehydrogenase [Alphaproteobacteria bacterium SO-S41]|nr:Inositol 2-dehydrogenase/D-chiro-inositol 3-dehydrogenase [Alphaproteobacteria bacterium SO-S41]
MTIRYAMIGGGPGAMIGEAHRMTARAAGFELVAGAFSSDPAKSQAQAVKSGLEAARGYATWPALIADAGALALDAIVIVTPNHLHAQPAIAALNAGLHVVCDKPLAVSVAQAEAIAEAARAANRIVGVTCTYAGFGGPQLAAKIVAEGGIGSLRLVQAEYCQDWLATKLEDGGQGPAAWRTDPARSGPAGATGDIGSHLWQMIEIVTGRRAAALSADLTALVEGRMLDDTALIRLRYPDGARGQMTITQAAVGGAGLRFQIMGDTGGVIWRQDDPLHVTLMKKGGATEVFDVANEGPFAAVKGPPIGFLDAFVDLYRRFGGAIRGEAVSYPGVEDGVRGMAFIEAAVASSKADGAWLTL